MSLRDELLAAVLAEPSRENCAVYADHLLALGEPRGDLISLDIAIEAADTVARAALMNRRAELVRAHGAGWWPWMGEAAARPGHKTRYGFQELIDLRVGPQTDPECLAREAVHAVHLGGLRPLGAGILRSSWLPSVRHLRTSVQAGDLAALAARALPRLAVLEVVLLSLDASPLADAMPALAQLVLRRGSWTDTSIHVPALAAWPVLARLHRLELGLGGSTGDLEPFLARDWPQLAELHVDGDFDGQLLVRLAARAAAFPALRVVSCYPWSLEKPAVLALNAAPFAGLELRVQRFASTLALDPRYTVKVIRRAPRS